MRNTPYPRYTIGHRSHAMFDLNKTPGLIQGIVELGEPKEITVEGLESFEYLPQGETRAFTEGVRLEIVEFGGHESKFGFVSKLRKQALDLEAGARIKGPVAWRAAEASGSLEAKVQGNDGFGRFEALSLAFTAILLVIAACLSPMSAAMILTTAALFPVSLLLYRAYQRHRRRLIAHQGSTYILAPKNEAWSNTLAVLQGK